MRILFTSVLMLVAGLLLTAQEPKMLPAAAQVEKTYLEFNSVMMDSTFKIYGPAIGDVSGKAQSTGTVFLVGRPNPATSSFANYVLVTASHVLESISGEFAVLVFRLRNDKGMYERREFNLAIRPKGKQRWVKHPRADVAAMYVGLPGNIAQQLINTSFLATDEEFQKYELSPGDDVLTVGYPYGIEANELGFPILRSGRIASYPLLPANPARGYLVDFAVFGGNSGGPVYVNYTSRLYNNTIHFGERILRIIGLVSQQLVRGNERLGVAGVIHSQFIRETIDLLPAPEIPPTLPPKPTPPQ